MTQIRPRCAAGVLYPPGFALGLQTHLPAQTTGSAVSAETVFTTSTGLPVALGSFPLAGSRTRRRAGAGECAAGFEWRYARNGAVACECPANALCGGETTCSVVPKAQEQWQVLLVPTIACSPQTTTAPAAILASTAGNVTPVIITPPPVESPPLGLILGLALGLGVPVLLGAGAASAYAVSRSKRPASDGGSVERTLPGLEAQPHAATAALLLSAVSGDQATAGRAAAMSETAASGRKLSGVQLSSNLAFPVAGEAALKVVAVSQDLEPAALPQSGPRSRPTEAAETKEKPTPPASGGLVADLTAQVEQAMCNLAEMMDACSPCKAADAVEK